MEQQNRCISNASRAKNPCDRSAPTLLYTCSSQIASFLSTAPTGECIFRPSSKGPTHLTATLKTPMGGSLLHIDIEEEGKPSPAELGAALWIGRLPKAEKSGDKFDDLDEILAR
eukprot:scaffold2522_cov22-Tisochrysis_lutea.AAC.4